MNAPIPGSSRLFRPVILILFLLTFGVAPAGAAQRSRSFCGICDHQEPCGQANQATCTSGSACDSGYFVWDIPDYTINCPGICGADETVTYACFDPNDPPNCSLCGDVGEPVCPTGTSCTPGCSPFRTPDADGLCVQCGGNGMPICEDGDPPCYQGYVQAGDTCYQPICGAAGEPICPNGACRPGIEPQGPICVDCGGDHEIECLLGSACRYGTRSIGPNQDGYRACAYCGGADDILACEDGVCDAGYYLATTDVLSAPITTCPALAGSADQTWYLNQNGICSPGTPDSFARTAPESWPPEEDPTPGRGTVVLIHGRGSSCGPNMGNLLDSGGVAGLGHLVYCVEYAQDDTPGVDRRLVQVLPVLDDVEGRPQGSCVATADCQFDHAHPVAQVLAATYDVPGVAAALAQALEEIPTDGAITLVPHSQGGFIARQLIYAHYDDLRWHGMEIRQVISLAHPYFVKHLDPHLYTPWLCATQDNFDCATGEWDWGWDLHVLNTPGSIDNSDYPQIDWTAVSGDGPPGSTTPEDVDGDGDTDAADDACLIFGGLSRLDVAGDTSVPIQSSLGYDEGGYFRRSALAFDRRYHADCTHTAACMFGAAETILPVCTPGGGSPPTPLDTCWGAEPARPLLPPSADLPRPTDSLRFDGDDQVAVTDPGALAALTVTSALTLETWIRPDADGQNLTFLSKEGEYELNLLPSTGKSVIAWAIKNTSPGWVSTLTAFAPPLNQWTHVALTYNGSTVRVYANGVEIQSTAASGAIGDVDPSRNELRIGGRQISPAALSGFLDDVRVWNRALTRHEVVAGMNGHPGAGNLSGLKGWWRFDEAGGDALLDSGPGGFTLSLSTLGAANTPVRVAARGRRDGGALYFDGVDDYAAVGDPVALVDLEMTTALTLEAWIFPRGTGTAGVGGVIVNKEGEYALTRWADGRITWSLANASPGWVSVQSTYVAPAHVWTHLALTYDATAGQVTLYIDGSPYQAWTATGPIGDFLPAMEELRIGGRMGSAQFFNGVIDDVRVFDVARSAAAIAADYDHALSDPAAVPGLVAYWRLDEAPAGAAFDSRGDHPLTLGSAAVAPMPGRALAPQLPGYTLLDLSACGNSQVDPLETCDDGGTIGGDGCSSGCRVENPFALHGSAQGGSVSMMVEGVSVQIFTVYGESLAAIAAALAAAINADPTLQERGITAVAVGDHLLVGGACTGIVITDPGLSDCSSGPSAPSIAGDVANICPATAAMLSAEGGYASYQWRFDGEPIAGATAASYAATLSGSYSVEVRDGFGCAATSPTSTVSVDFCAATEVSPAGAIFPLRVINDAASPTGRYIYFQRVGGADGYHLYIGTAGSYYSHGASPDDVCGLVHCVMPNGSGCYDDLGTGELRAAAPAGPADAYYLVSAYASGVEGPSGRDSAGDLVDPTQSTCLP